MAPLRLERDEHAFARARRRRRAHPKPLARSAMLARVVRPVSPQRSVVLRVAWPIAVSNLFETLALSVDLVMVGSLGVAAIAAMSLSMEIFLFGLAIATAFATGVRVLVARAMGERDQAGVDRAATGGMLLAFAASLPLAAAAFVFARPLVSLMTSDAAVADDAADVLRILALAIPSVMVWQTAEGALEGAGDARPLLAAGVFMNVVNLAMGWVLIFGHLGAPALGLKGAALATLIAEYARAVVYLGLMVLRRRAVGLTIRDLRFRDTTRRVLRIGAPASASELVVSIGILAYIVMILHFGVTALAAHEIALQVESAVTMVMLGFAAAATALVGQWLGKRNADEAEASGWMAIALALGAAVLLAIPFALFAGPFASLFTDDPLALEAGRTATLLMCAALPALAVYFVAEGALHGAGDTRVTFAITFAGLWLVRLPLAWILGSTLGFGIVGVWAAFVIDYYVRAGGTLARFMGRRWRGIVV